jgi:NADPH-dependent curcumin reductase CurA
MLVAKSGMNYAKPFVLDYRRPKDAEDIVAGKVEGAMNKSTNEDYKDEDIVIGLFYEDNLSTGRIR